MNDKNRLTLADALRVVPSHRETPQTIAAIGDRLELLGKATEKTSLVSAALDLLGLFDALTWDGQRCRLQSQGAFYFRESLLWYLDNSQPILSNWRRYGVSGDLHLTHLLEAAPYFLRIAEERRVELSERQGLDPGFSRLQPVSVVLLKATARGEIYFLHSWDSKAEQLQLIGGRQREGETPMETAHREFLEEAGFRNSPRNAQLILGPLHEKAVHWREISRTYGALTEYRFHFFGASIRQAGVLASGAEWVSLTDMRRGKTANGRVISQIFRRLEEVFPGILLNLAAAPLAIDDSTDAMHQPAGGTTTIYYGPVVGSMTGSQIQLGGAGSSQSLTETTLPFEELRSLVSAIASNLVEAKSELSEFGELRAHLATMEAQLRVSQPSASILKEAWSKAQVILEHAAAHVVGAAFYHQLPEMVARMSSLLS